MENFHGIFLASHIGAGVLALLSGLLPLLTFKGGKLHRLSGKFFFWSMFWLFFTSLISFFFFRGNFFLLVIGIFSFHACFVGYRVLYRKKPGEQTWVDWAGAIITLLAGVGVIIYAVFLYLKYGMNHIVILSIIFGILTTSDGVTDVKLFRMKHVDDKMWWFYHHMEAMCGAFIAALTAFAVNALGPMLYQYSWGWLIWIIPPAIAIPGVAFWVRYYKRKFNGGQLPKKNKTRQHPAPSN